MPPNRRKTVINGRKANQFLLNGKFFDDGQCSICFSAPQIDKSCPPCGHVFCCQCLTEWNNYGETCPVCKNEFTKIAHINRKDQITSVHNSQVRQHKCSPSIAPWRYFHSIFILFTTGVFCLGIWIAMFKMYELETRFNFPARKIFKALFIVRFVYFFGGAYKYGFDLQCSIFIGVVLSFTLWV